MARPITIGLLLVLTACGARGPQEVAESPAPAATPEDASGGAKPPDPRTTEGPEPAVTPPAPAETSAPEVQQPSAAAARSPRRLAAALLAAERTIRDPDASRSALAAAGHEQQIVFRRLVRRARWREPVLDALPAKLRPAAERNLHAGEQLLALVTPQPQMPDWRIRRPAPAAELREHYRGAGRAFGIDWQYLAAIHLVETRMGRIRGTSTAGAQGPMQFMPATWDAYGEGDVNDNGDAIMAAARYLAAHGAPGDMDGALWAYNHSDRYVAAVSAYARNMLDETRTYRGYYHWQVYYLHVDGDVMLPVGYGR